jgi:hypothetical protein
LYFTLAPITFDVQITSRVLDAGELCKSETSGKSNSVSAAAGRSGAGVTAHPKSNYQACLLSTQMDCIANEFDLLIPLVSVLESKDEHTYIAFVRINTPGIRINIGR